jgi:hypothetical protein
MISTIVLVKYHISLPWAASKLHWAAGSLYVVAVLEKGDRDITMMRLEKTGTKR